MTKAAPQRKHYGDGLYLQTGKPTKKGKVSASWLLRYQRNGAEHWMGLGAKKTFTLQEAKKRALKHRQLLADKIDPLEAQRENERLKALDAARSITFAAAAQQYFEGH
jgi:hypothetical protein